MNLINFDQLKDFEADNTEIVLSDWPSSPDSISINLWMRYVNHIENLMSLDPSLRFFCSLDDFTIFAEKNMNFIDKYRYIMPQHFTIENNIHLFNLGYISIPNNFRTNDGIIHCHNTVMDYIPENLFGAHKIVFGRYHTQNKELFDDFYPKVAEPLKSSSKVIVKNYYDDRGQTIMLYNKSSLNI